MVRRAIIFDLDGTLIDSAADITSVLNRMLAARSMQPTSETSVRRLVGLAATDIVKSVFGDRVATMDVDAAVAEFQATYRSIPPDPGALFPHALNVMHQLRQQGLTLGICTNKPEDNARRIITGIGLDPHIEAIVGKREGLPPKPSPAAIFEVLRQLKASTSEAVYIGDSEVDAATAQAADVPFVLVSFGYPMGNIEDIACAARIDDFRELPDRLLAF